ncbi:NB-ARC domain-containing protein [candidate division KSB1 bacterium]|nr:NB-ARC domain-containing protein [candidate division KSB1 bacterium]
MQATKSSNDGEVKDKPKVFLSYSRKDGFDFARNLRQKLEKLGFSFWQDIISLEGGRDFWLQITEALDHVEFMVLVLSDGAMESPIVRKEWRYARQQGVCVYPVKGELFSEEIHQSLPRWMREAHYYDLDIEEQWQKLVNDLHKSCETVRVPFMVEDKPDDFVERPEEFNQLLALLLNPKREEPIAITAALRGAGGYGKTTLAKALCHDEAIQNAFDDGILWVTLGENPGDLTGRVEDLIYTLSDERPEFSSVQAAAARFAELLADRDILLVIDDVWNSAHLKPFLQGGSRCSRLITTRNSDTLPAKAKGIDLDAMRTDEATSLLGFNLPESEVLALQRLAQRLGEWPLLLKLVNATLRYHVYDLQQSFAAAIAYVNAALDECGLIAFDQDNATERHQAVAKTLEVSLQMLAEGERQHYFELAIFPEDVNIPLATLEKLWAAAGYKPIHTEKLCEKLHKLSLLLHFDLSDRTIRLHDVMRQYLVQKIGAELPKLHAQFLYAYRSTTSMQTWANLPADEPYLWRHLAYHLIKSGQPQTLHDLLWDYDWLHNKLAVSEINALLADYDFFPEDRELRLVQSALRLSANQLTRDRQQLPSHLLGRLLGQTSPDTQSLLAQATKKAKRPWLRPLTPSLTTPGGPLLRTLEGHSKYVNAVAITPDGKYAVSASSDKTLKVWDLTSGQTLRTLEGHSDEVNSVAITPNGEYAVSASKDKTLKVWDLTSGQVLRTLVGHISAVYAVAITPDGKYAVSASKDKTLKVWDLASGQVLQTLEGHSALVNNVAITPDGKYAVSASFDRTLKVWDLASGQALQNLKEHRDLVSSVVITPDGKYVVSTSTDKTLKVWDLISGQVLQNLKGHRDLVSSVVITPDGKHAVLASRGKTHKVRDLASGQTLRTLKGHRDRVTSVLITPDGKYGVSASEDHTLKVWELATEKAVTTFWGESPINCCAIAPDGRTIVAGERSGRMHFLRLEGLET